MHELLLERGRFFLPAERPDSVSRLKQKACFENAFLLASQSSELVYVEGLAVWSGLYLHHAWCVDARGVVVDPTWPEAGSAYLGLPFGPWVAEPPCFGPGLIEERSQLYPLLESGLPPNALVDVGRQPASSTA